MEAIMTSVAQNDESAGETGELPEPFWPLLPEEPVLPVKNANAYTKLHGQILEAYSFNDLLGVSLVEDLCNTLWATDRLRHLHSALENREISSLQQKGSSMSCSKERLAELPPASMRGSLIGQTAGAGGGTTDNRETGT
jgi:hypothetical protein